MRMPRLLLVLSAFLSLGCSSVQARGRILDAFGKPVENASAAVRVDGAGPALETATSDQNGCFNIYVIKGPHEPRFVLEVRAPGRKTETFRFERKERDPLLVTLVDPSAAQPGGIRAATAEERTSQYDLYCVPWVVPGAMSLGLR
jgi:hypothetical protein